MPLMEWYPIILQMAVIITPPTLQETVKCHNHPSYTFCATVGTAVPLESHVKYFQFKIEFRMVFKEDCFIQCMQGFFAPLFYFIFLEMYQKKKPCCKKCVHPAKYKKTET